MAQEKTYWRDWSERQLASYQQDQGSSNHCAKYAAATSLNLLFGREIKGERLIDWVGSRPLKGTGRYTIWGNNNGSLVYQTSNLLRLISSLESVSPSIRCRIGDRSFLRRLLQQSGSLALVSLTYFQGQEPVIARGENTGSSLGTARLVGGHVMIAAAYDPGHHNQMGVVTPWGFLSSWGAKDQLYWMTDNDFNRCWGKLSIYNMVIIKTASTN